MAGLLAAKVVTAKRAEADSLPSNRPPSSASMSASSPIIAGIIERTEPSPKTFISSAEAAIFWSPAVADGILA